MSEIWEEKPIDEITRKRIDSGAVDHQLNLDIVGVRIGNTGKVRWSIEQHGCIEYDEQYVADVLEKVVEVIRNNLADTDEL